MKNLDTKTLINFLPLPPDFKVDLLEKFDSLSKEEQLKISDIAWEAYLDEYDFQIKYNFDLLVSEAEKAGREPDPDTYQKAVAKTEEEINHRLTTSSDSTDLTAARKSMEKIVKEINAAKKQNTP